MTANPQKITFGEMRASGIRDVLIYCRDHHCSHHMEISAGRWGDQVRLSDVRLRLQRLRQARLGRAAEVSGSADRCRLGRGKYTITKLYDIVDPLVKSVPLL